MGSMAGRSFVCRILARQHLERTLQLRVIPPGVAEIERHPAGPDKPDLP